MGCRLGRELTHRCVEQDCQWDGEHVGCVGGGGEYLALALAGGTKRTDD